VGGVYPKLRLPTSRFGRPSLFPVVRLPDIDDWADGIAEYSLSRIVESEAEILLDDRSKHRKVEKTKYGRTVGHDR
jgi:hypothetical protein